jgi:hypothetical protein
MVNKTTRIEEMATDGRGGGVGEEQGEVEEGKGGWRGGGVVLGWGGVFV